MAQRAPGVRGLHQPRGRQLEHPGVHMCTEAVLFYMDTAQVFSGVHLYVHTASSIQVTIYVEKMFSEECKLFLSTRKLTPN